METTQHPNAGGESVSRPATATATASKPATRPVPGTTPRPKEAPVEDDRLKSRRKVVWAAVSGFLGINFLMFLRFFFPRTLFEPSSRFRIGYLSDFNPGVDERFKQAHRIWVVKEADKLFVIFGKCTHLGCTPNWIETEHKFKCPCHGSGYDMEGRNFEGPAPRPMDRAYVELDAEGQIVVDTSRLFTCPPGGKCEFDTAPGSYLPVS